MVSVKKNKFYPYGSAVFSMLLWGMSFVWTAIVLDYYQPVTIIFLRLIISTLFLFIWIRLFQKPEKIQRKDLPLFFLSALFNPFLYFLGENYGVKFTSPTISAVMIATIPIVASIVAYFRLKEKMSFINIVGVIISFLGIMVMLLNRNFELDASPVGILALLLAVGSAVGYVIYLKILSTRYSPFFIIAFQNLIGIFYFLPFFVIFDFQQFISVTPDFKVISSLIALAVFCSSIAFVAFTIATREIGVSKANVFANLIPVFTGIFSFLVIGEELHLQKILGIVIVVGGLFFSQLKKPIQLGAFNRY
jgi:drug/metabolite transporter (DMT)-like permease